MIKLSDYIIKRLKEHGIERVFMISGGGAMHLNDSVGKLGMDYVCSHHEQASAIAAEGQARITGKTACVIVTTGPGGINTLTGVMGQWTDSVPVIYISGQVKRETCMESYPSLHLRQLGDQEADIIGVVKPITKFAHTLNKPEEVKKVIDKAVFIAKDGRPGPVWVNVPIDIQGAMIDEDTLDEYDLTEDDDCINHEKLKSRIVEVVELLHHAKRPVIIAGQGIRIAGAQELFLELVKKLQIPVISTFNGMDLIASDNPLYIGRIGTIGDRAGNFALQNADVVICIGSRNNIRQVSYNWKCFAHRAKLVVVDIDKAELEKSTVNPYMVVHADAKEFLTALKIKTGQTEVPDGTEWLNWCLERKNRYPVVIEEYKKSDSVNPYYFIDLLTQNLKENAVVVTANGTACVCTFQAGKVKENQRYIWNSGCASMGYGLPAAIGACFANEKKDVICIEGDGSIQMNLQELQTIAHHNLPVKLFVLNNCGYSSIKQTQDAFFGGNYVACNCESGVSCPDIKKIASAYGLPVEIIEHQKDMDSTIQRVLNIEGPVVCEVILTPDYIFSPKLSSERLPDGRIISKPLEDMYPFLPREEFENNIIID